MSLFRATAKRLPIPENSVDLIFTDPPYPRKFLNCYDWLADEAARVLRPGSFVLAMCGGSYINRIMRLFDNAGLQFYWQYKVQMVGSKTGLVWPRGNRKVNISIQTKSIIAYSKGDGLPQCSTVDFIRSGGPDKRYHHWGQNVSEIRYYIECFSRKGDLVLDPFIGGGSTAVVCELLSRRWLGCDLDTYALYTTRERMNGADILKQAPLFAGMGRGAR